jgi:hypothetical protein
MEGVMTFQTDDRSRAIRRRGRFALGAFATSTLALSLATTDPAAAQHGVCSAGSALSSTASCVSQICAVDPFCCNTSWDNICISEVNTVCGSDECAPGAIVIDAFDGGFMGTVNGVDTVNGPSIIVTENTNSVPPPSDIRRQWHKFDLSGVTHRIARAQLQFDFPPGAYGSSSPFVNLTVWDVTSDPNSFGWDPAIRHYRPYSPAVFNDVGSGTPYGGRYYTAADEGTLTVIPLNASGVAGVNASLGGVFAVGATGPYYACVSPCNPVPAKYIFQNTGTVEGDPTFGLPTLRRLVLVPPECSNGVDDDGDGRIDYPADPGCSALASASESPQCQDGLDNDNQPGIDFDGGASLDLNRDGFIDTAFNPLHPPVGAPDPQCVGTPWKNKEVSGCGLGYELALILPPLFAMGRRRRTA